jgi:hypothetical protein
MEEGSNILNKLKESSRELYTVPEGYFEQFPEQMLQKAKAGEPAKVIPMSFGKRIFRYAAVAVVVGFIALGSWLWLKKPNTADNSIAQTEKAVLQQVQNISDSEVANYIEKNSDLTTTGNKSLVDMDMRGEDGSLLLADIPDEELQQYLEQHNASKFLLN